MIAIMLHMLLVLLFWAWQLACLQGLAAYIERMSSCYCLVDLFETQDDVNTYKQMLSGVLRANLPVVRCRSRTLISTLTSHTDNPCGDGPFKFCVRILTTCMKMGSGCCRAVEEALRAGHTKLLMLESPTNPRMQICDIATLTKMAHQVSRTIAAPMQQQHASIVLHMRLVFSPTCQLCCTIHVCDTQILLQGPKVAKHMCRCHGQELLQHF